MKNTELTVPLICPPPTQSTTSTVTSMHCVLPLYNWCSSLPDYSLIPHTLLPAVFTVTEFWKTDDDNDDELGLLDALLVPDSVNDDIRANPSYSTEEEKRIAGLQYYLQTVPGASLERIAGALWRMEEHTALEEVRQYLPSTQGEWFCLFGSFFSITDVWYLYVVAEHPRMDGALLAMSCPSQESIYIYIYMLLSTSTHLYVHP